MTFLSNRARSPRAARALRLAALLAGAAWLGSPSAAVAQAAHPDCTIAANNCFYAFGQTNVTVSTSQSLVFNAPTVTTNQTTSFQTELIGKITGGTPLYDRIFALPFGDPAVQAGVAQARLAITTAGGPGVVILGPVLTSHTVTVSSSSVTSYSFNHSAVTTDVTTTIGNDLAGSAFVIDQHSGATTLNGVFVGTIRAPTQFGVFVAGDVLVEATLNGQLVPGAPPPTYIAGTRSDCTAAIAALPSTARPVCAGGSQTNFLADAQPIYLAGGQVGVNVNTDTADFIDQATTTTTDTLTSEVYTLTGTVKPIGTVHAVAPVAGFDQAEQFAARLFAMPDGSGLWIDGWGQRATTPGRGDTPGDTRNGGGLDGGFQVRASNALRLGASVNWGHTGIGLPDVGESGDFDLTTGALNAAFHAGPLFLDAAAGYGAGHVSTSVSPPGFGATATGRNNLNIVFGGARAGWRMKLGAVALTPHAGFTVTAVHTGGFAEAGSALALRAPSADFHRTQLYAGLDAGVALSPAFEIGGFARVDTRLGDLAPTLPATFVSLAAGGPMLTIQGPRDGRTGADLGAHASLRLTDRIRAFAGYQANVGSHSTSQFANIGIAVATF